MTSTIDLDAGAVLAAARRFRSAADAAEVGVLRQAVEWCRLHEVADEGDAATWRETGLALAGVGAPLVAEFCVSDFGACLGLSTDSARTYLAHALELAHRLPHTFDRAVSGSLPVWRARRVAEHTISLSPEAAAYVDQQIAPFAHKVGPAATERLVEEAVLRFMPDTAAELAAQAADGRHVRIVHDHAAGAGTSSIYGNLDTADAIDLEQALRDGAAALKAAGAEESLEVRRSLALGDLARGERPLGLATSDQAGRFARDVTLYVHLSPDSDIAQMENAGGHLVTKEQVARWCSTGDARVVIKPVIDLRSTISTDTYAIPERIREHVVLRDGACVFPWCSRSARRSDLDHIHPHERGGATSTTNLAPLCRRHHRVKTFTDWTYTMVVRPDEGGLRPSGSESAAFLWRSPHGYQYLRDSEGTQALTPRPVDPPGR